MRLLSGRATADQVARQNGGLPETVLDWRDAALAGIESALALRDGRIERECALELEVRTLKETLGQATVDRALPIQAVEEWKQQSCLSRPTPPCVRIVTASRWSRSTPCFSTCSESHEGMVQIPGARRSATRRIVSVFAAQDAANGLPLRRKHFIISA